MLHTNLGLDAFRMRHRWDRPFLLALLLIIWAAMIAGFGTDVVQKYAAHKLDYPWIVHVHAIVFVGWLALLTAQMLLIRAGNVALHRRVGIVALAFVPVMIVLGPATGLVMNAAHYGHPQTEFPLFAIQLINTAAFAGLVGVGFAYRRRAALHKRMMLMATIALTVPGFSRLLFKPIGAAFGTGLVPAYTSFFGGTTVLLLAIGCYDVITRGRILPAYGWALVWCLANQALGLWLFFQPWWGAWTGSLAH